MPQFETLLRSTHDFSGAKTITVKKVGRTAGYDGHSLRAYSYFGDQMPDIDPNSVESINSIGNLYEELRQRSKSPTFALTV